MIQRYISKISGPLMDRIDIHIDVPAVNYKEMRSTNEPESSAKIRERVMRTRQKQLERFASSREKIYCNAQMSSRHIRAHCELSPDCERLLERAMTQQGLSARAHDRILKVARTIADIEETPQIEPKHIAEAIQYRSLDRTTGPKKTYEKEVEQAFVVSADHHENKRCKPRAGSRKPKAESPAPRSGLLTLKARKDP